MASKTFALIFQGKSFSISEASLLKHSTFVQVQRDAWSKGSYDVQSTASSELFEQFIKAVESNTSIAITAENVDALSALSTEFGATQIEADIAAFQSLRSKSATIDTVPKLRSLQERISRHDHLIADLQRQISDFTTMHN
jgi:hypothetical protein